MAGENAGQDSALSLRASKKRLPFPKAAASLLQIFRERGDFPAGDEAFEHPESTARMNETQAKEA